jgi:hypothetical protein
VLAVGLLGCVQLDQGAQKAEAPDLLLVCPPNLKTK